jgi:O-antigen ligase
MPFAHTYAPAFIFIAGFVLVDFKVKSSWKWLAVITTIATALIASLSMTRGVWLGMLAGIALISFLRNRRYGVLFPLAVGVVFSLILALSPATRERTFSTNSAVNQSDNQRKALWLGNIEIIKDYPLFGTGYSQNKNYLPPYYEKLGFPKDQFVSHAHNQYLHLWAGTGTLGLLCYLIFLFTTIRLTALAYFRLTPDKLVPRSLALGSLGAQVCFIVGSLTESNFSIAKNRYIFLLISAVGVSLYYRYVSKTNFEKYQDQGSTP